MAIVKSNKPRGKVLLNEESAPGTTKTANPQRKDINQARGPQSGNQGTPSKQRSFLEEKSDRSSRFQQLANMVTDALSTRGQGMKPHLDPTVEPLHENTNVGRRKSK